MQCKVRHFSQISTLSLLVLRKTLPCSPSLWEDRRRVVLGDYRGKDMARSLIRGRMVQQTVWLKGEEHFDTGTGRHTKLKWLERERDRILMDPSRQAEVRFHKWREGYAALFVNDVRDWGARL